MSGLFDETITEWRDYAADYEKRWPVGRSTGWYAARLVEVCDALIEAREGMRSAVAECLRLVEQRDAARDRLARIETAARDHVEDIDHEVDCSFDESLARLERLRSILGESEQ